MRPFPRGLRARLAALAAVLMLPACGPAPPPEDPAAAAARSLFETARDGVHDLRRLDGVVRRDLLDAYGPALIEILPELGGWTALRVLDSSRLPDGATMVDLEASYPSNARASFTVSVSEEGTIQWILTPGAEWPAPPPARDEGLTTSTPG